jgi:dGTPase
MGSSLSFAPELNRLRFPVEATRGRLYPEEAHPYRNDFQRDRDRIVHSRAFRRLENKTQVFSPGRFDHFRNRLTHTIEVSQIARTVASVLGLNEDLTEALALAHDIGHPPFAHSGEEELNRQMAAFGDRFDHNLHALRMVVSFEQRYARYRGLNLTFEVREGIVKHSRDIPPKDAALLSEYLPALRPPLEAQLIDLADEVAYNTADLDDGFAARFVTMTEVTREIPLYAEFRHEVEALYPQANEKTVFQEVLRRLVDTLTSGLIEGTVRAALASGVANTGDVRNYPARLARMESPAAEINAALKTFLRAHVYFTPSLVLEREEAMRHIAELFHFYLDRPETLPENYRREAERAPLHRVVCDYIAGMTDGYFRRVYGKCCHS